jgi:hypothetical protein
MAGAFLRPCIQPANAMKEKAMAAAILTKIADAIVRPQNGLLDFSGHAQTKANGNSSQ